MRTALQAAIPRERAGTSGANHLPAPTGGWNTRDSVVGMNPRDALVLDNWFPQASEVCQRGGSTNFATGLSGGTVKSLAQWTPTSGTKKLIAFTDAGAYDVTAGGTISSLMTGSAFTNGYVNTLMFTNSAGNSFLWACNGVDTPMYYNGTTWTAATITGLTPANIAQAWVFKHRIWFIEKDTMNTWFLPIDSIQGPASQFPLGSLFKAGGTLIAGTNWTIDGGEGPDDALVVASSEGEVVVYQGTDPISASSFSLSGVFQVSKPCGRKCFFKLGGDVAMIAESGVFPLSRALQLGSINFTSALSNKIQPSVVDATRIGGVTTEGWEGCVFPRWNAMIVNIPNQLQLQGGVAQFVMNTMTGQWCSFSNWPASCFSVMDGKLYFGAAAGKVRKAWDGLLTDDVGQDITATVYTAYQVFGSVARMKVIKLLRFLFAYDGTIDARWAVSADYSDVVMQSFLKRLPSVPGAIWDVSPWDTSSWALDVTRFKDWKSVSHPPGYALSLRLQTAGKTSTQLRWAGNDLILQGAGLM